MRDVPPETPPGTAEVPQVQGCPSGDAPRSPKRPLKDNRLWDVPPLTPPPRHGDKGHTTHTRGQGGLEHPPREQQHTRHRAKKAPRWSLAKSSSLFSYSQQ